MKLWKTAILVGVSVLGMSHSATAQSQRSGNSSAKVALKSLAKERGAEQLRRIVMVEGRYGSHQPKAWRILASDPKLQGRMREFMITGTQIASERVIMAWNRGNVVSNA